MEETWKTSLKTALRQLGTHLPPDDDEEWEWMLPFEELRTAPRNALVRWYSDSAVDADHVYSSWLDIYVIWPPGRAPRGPGYHPANEYSHWVWVAFEPNDADANTWTAGSRMFSRALIIEPDVDLWRLVSPEGAAKKPLTRSQKRRWRKMFPIVVPLGHEIPTDDVRRMDRVAASTGLEPWVERGWSCNAISRALSEWSAELLGRGDLAFHCCH